MGFLSKAIHQILKPANDVLSAIGLSSPENAEYQNAFNRESAEIQRQWQLQDYAYNTPLEQRKRWEEAGFNPYQILGSMDTGNASGSVPSIAASADPTNSVAASFLNGLISTVAQLPVSVAQSRNLNANTEGQVISNQLANERELANIAKMKADGDLSKKTAENISQDLKLKQDTYQDAVRTARANAYEAEQRGRAQESIALQEQERVSLAKELVSEARTTNEFAAKRFAKELEVMASQIDLNKSGALLNAANRAHALAMKLGIDYDNSVKFRVQNYLVRQQQYLTQEQQARAGIAAFQSHQAKNDLHMQKLQIRQMGADYWNPFGYVGKALGGGASITKAVK